VHKHQVARGDSAMQPASAMACEDADLPPKLTCVLWYSRSFTPV